MKKFKNRSFDSQVIRIDQAQYEGCKFKSCTIEYGGDGPISLKNCVFDDCLWRLTGSALNTIVFLRDMHSSMGEFGKMMVGQTIETITKSPEVG